MIKIGERMWTDEEQIVAVWSSFRIVPFNTETKHLVNVLFKNNSSPVPVDVSTEQEAIEEVDRVLMVLQAKAIR